MIESQIQETSASNYKIIVDDLSEIEIADNESEKYFEFSYPQDTTTGVIKLRIYNPHHKGVSTLFTTTVKTSTMEDNDHQFEQRRILHERHQKDSYKLISSLEETAFEDGLFHPAESEMSTYLSSKSRKLAHEFIMYLYYKLYNKPSTLSALIRCLGRQKPALIDSIIFNVFYKALTHNDLEVRSSAIFALDQIANKDSIKMIENHKEDSQHYQL